MTPPDTERLPAGAGRISDMFFQVLKYDVFGDGPVGRREIPTSPKPSPPVALFQLRKFALYLVG